LCGGSSSFKEYVTGEILHTVLNQKKKRTRDLCNTRREIQTHKTRSTIFKEWTTPDLRNTPSTTNLDEEEIVDALENDGNALMPKQVNRPNPWRKMIIIKEEFHTSLNICKRLQEKFLKIKTAFTLVTCLPRVNRILVMMARQQNDESAVL
jgi:hypothetical protein